LRMRQSTESRRTAMALLQAAQGAEPARRLPTLHQGIGFG
jgi:hypothetical protein